jgi:hypothetical protein
MSIKVQLFKGEDCSFKEGCAINLQPNTSIQKFDANSKYYLLEGTLLAQYAEEAEQTISSPYNATWSGYVDSWDYTKNVFLKVSQTTVFVGLSVKQGNTENHLETVSSVAVIKNSSISASMKANSYMLIVGSDYKVDDTEYSNQKTRIIFASSPKNLTMSTPKSCSLVYIEPI